VSRSRRLRRPGGLGTRLTKRRLFLAGAALALLPLALLTARFVVWPETDRPIRTDAVVVLAGGEERLPAALELMERRLAPVFVVSRGPRDLCAREARYEIVCFRPEPDRTQGEARATSRLAAERGWRSLVVVTSRYHAVRARMLFRRCFGGALRVVGVEPNSPRGLPSLRNVVWEWGGFAHAFVLERGC
jgi:uncharacterized SAM-binding protein YcdF (DUF218 family)